ncbi:MAG: hypothetical protein M1277_01605, partial [Patescibacteria group bacterium]|nr:hypothetical protein [Patescibacteria group bacterium]
IQKQTAPTTTIINQTTTTKGGLTVLPAPKIVATPSTGPEALPLLALLPTGFIGFLIRKKYTAFKS